jgi:hypothetical protein
MRRRLVGAILVWMLAALPACGSRPRERRDGPKAAATTRLAPAAPSSRASASAPVSAAAAPRPAPPPIAVAAGELCQLSRGPVQLAYTGAALLVVEPDVEDPRIVINVEGTPRAVTLPAAPKAAAAKNGKPAEARQAERLALSEPAVPAPLSACAAAGGFYFCADKVGDLRRSARLDEPGKVLARARAGSPIAAAPAAFGHTVYAYLGDRKTSEGATTQAFAAVDDGPPVLLSEEGAGATFVALAPRGEEVVAMYVDARRVLTPVHARVLGGGAKLTLGPDAVLFVGGGADARVLGAIAQGAPGTELALLATEKDMKDFGLAAIKIDEQPRDDAPVTWSLYPGAIDRAAIAATQGVTPVLVLRVRPTAPNADEARLLELGQLEGGAFKALCTVAEGKRFQDLAVAADRKGGVWLAYTDGDGTWVERRGR